MICWGAGAPPVLTATTQGQGTLRSTSTTGIQCPGDCAELYQQLDTITLTAEPAPGQTFLGWEGYCTGNSPTCDVLMNAPRSVTARFSESSQQFPVASFTATPSIGPAPLKVILDHSASNDPDGEIVAYNWSVNGAPMEAQSGLLSTTKTITLGTPGTYTINLKVTDNDGLTDETQRTVIVQSGSGALTLSPAEHAFGEMPAVPIEEYTRAATRAPQTEALDELFNGDRSQSTDRVIVKYRDGVNPKQRIRGRDSFGASLIDQIDLINAEVWQVWDARSLVEGRAPGDYTDIEYIEPDVPLELLRTPNDARYGELWGLHNTGANGGTADADIDAPEAWNLATGGEITCAVVDTGIDHNHPDLQANVWTNPGEIPNNGKDDDGNGYIDDIHGWNFVDDTPITLDGYGHGTHVAGTIAAVGDNGIGVTGVNWQGKVMALKIFDDSGVGGDSSYVIKALDYAVKMGIKCSNHSYRTVVAFNSRALTEAMRRAEKAGHLIIAAAGNNLYRDNDRYPTYPASYPHDNILSVCATDRNDNKPDFSHYGARSVDLCAPGNGIVSTRPNQGYDVDSGTSMAAPHVTGAVGLVWSRHPQMSASEIKRAILGGVDQKSSLASYNLTGGRLNLLQSLDKVLDSTEAFTLANTTGSTLTISQIQLAGYDPDDFQIHANQCSGQTLANNQSCTLRIAFAPQTGGNKNATLEIIAGGQTVQASVNGSARDLPNSNAELQYSGDDDGDGIPNEIDPDPKTQAGDTCPAGESIITLSYATLTGNHRCEAQTAIYTGTSVNIGSDSETANVEFAAGAVIRLLPGFVVKPNSTFQAITSGKGDVPIVLGD